MSVCRLFIYIFLLVFVFSGCANTNSRYRYENGYHIVKSGETLYEISFNYGLDYKTVARWNGIRHPYRIYPGQRIRVSADYAGRRTAQKASTPKSTATTGTKKPAVTRTTTTKHVAKPGEWQWPVKGKLITRFANNATGSKGIDIVATEGSSIRAAAAGKVVYSGSGLRGYGNLIIIKHSDTYLSAYAHNRRLLVAEGASVKRGQKIAELGSSGTGRPKLHFEIRRNGQPVDPLRYLPKP